MLRLLIADDEIIIREALSGMIDYASLGYELIGTAKNGMEAYDIICDEYPDVVITDIRMPILNGLDLIEKVRKSDRQVIFIILSGYGEFEYAQKAMRFGVSHYLLKPIMKQELIDTLIQIRQDCQKQEAEKWQKQQEILGRLRLPLQQSFVMEALEHIQDFPRIYSRYEALNSLPIQCKTACLCFFVEEAYLSKYIQDVNRILKKMNLFLDFPIIYVRNTAIIICSLDSLSIQEELKGKLSKLKYKEQSTSFEPSIIHKENSRELFEHIIRKISRYERILLFTGEEPYEIVNFLASPQKLQLISGMFKQAETKEQLESILQSLFPDSREIQETKTLAVSIFLEMNKSTDPSIDFASDFFRKLYSCTDSEKIRELLKDVLFAEKGSGKMGNIAMLKAYVEQHLDSEELSLKWLAENYLFVNVGYLSKQFVKEEGIRFSEYLNKMRMEEAIHLMVYYKNDNIKHIARQVGFGSNPQYFSQVFKKYTGSTPTDYIEMLKKQ